MPPNGLRVDAARQVALSIEVPLVEVTFEVQGRGKGGVVARLIPSMSMDQVPRRVTALLPPLMPP